MFRDGSFRSTDLPKRVMHAPLADYLWIGIGTVGNKFKQFSRFNG